MAQDLGRTFYHRDHPHRQLHHHERELELNLVVRGRCRYLVDGVRLDLGPGHLLWLPPGRSHLLIDTGPDCTLLVAMAELAGLRRRSPLAPHTELAARSCLRAPARLLARAPAARLADLLALAAEAEDPARREAALVLAVLQGWAEWTAAGATAAGAEVHPGVARAAELLADDPVLALPALARASGLGGDLLGRLFRRELGLTLTAFRQQCRLERYQRLRSEHPRRTLLWCALTAGFGSYAQFHRVHRLQLGRSPRQEHA